jgi:lipopolysaccharide assembly outer membrane protein LptD (OstA)
VVGYAYRPVRHDRLSGLAKYTYFYNVPTTDQVGLQGTAAEFIQKSHIAALDLTYDLTTDWSIGGKYAYRLGQVSLDREERKFFDNAAQLVVLRADWRFRKGWESVIEGRCSTSRMSVSAAAARWPRSTVTSART